jgi:DNA mismatch repair protein PMS2
MNLFPALKHYTSKLSTFDDLASLKSFGFRGEALSSLCALSNFHIITARADQVPKASRLDFEASGKLKGTQVVAGQKGTTVIVENLFQRLPVRRRELERNIKREYGKVLGLLHAYACISAGVRFSVKNHMPKGKSVLVFSTKSNTSTWENISNVYGAKTLLALTPLDLELEFEPSDAAKKFGGQQQTKALNKIFVHGYVSKPVFGEGRQTPDRQMFFVNSRPCGLPQIAKAFNEVYKSFNISQSPFIFANFQMDTSSYDVNVSPDKRTILLHDAAALIESLKPSLTALFEKQDQTMPQSQVLGSKQMSMKQVFERQGRPSDYAADRIERTAPSPVEDEKEPEELDEVENVTAATPRQSMQSVLQRFSDSQPCDDEPSAEQPPQHATLDRDGNPPFRGVPETVSAPSESTPPVRTAVRDELSTPTRQAPIPALVREPVPKTPGIVQNAFDRMRARRTPPDIATITISGKTVTSRIGGSGMKRNFDISGFGQTTAVQRKRRIHTVSLKNRLSQNIRTFLAPGTQADEIEDGSNEEEPEADRSNASDVDAEDQDEAASEEDAQSEPSGEAVGDAWGSDEDYVDEAESKTREEARVEELVRAAEETTAALPSEEHEERANRILKKARDRDSTVNLMCSIDGSITRIQAQLKSIHDKLRDFRESHSLEPEVEHGSLTSQPDAEAKLSLTVSKDDFAEMRIIGQFNLGFILATRVQTDGDPGKDELFIIDQHASDEKFNFERLQAETVVQSQRLVRPKTLDLTAVEEEVIVVNLPALEKNGFVVEVDTSGDEPIGRRCKLTSLPLSKEVVFDTRDLEELIVLLSEAPQSTALSDDRYIPRPTKVRKMFAMRACRSSIMVGKTLTQKQMEKVVRHMGMIDKPWNCPHGRPTMRHLMSLGQWNVWNEWDWSTENPDAPPVDSLHGSEAIGLWTRFLRDYPDVEAD